MNDVRLPPAKTSFHAVFNWRSFQRFQQCFLLLSTHLYTNNEYKTSVNSTMISLDVSIESASRISFRETNKRQSENMYDNVITMKCNFLLIWYIFSSFVLLSLSSLLLSLLENEKIAFSCLRRNHICSKLPTRVWGLLADDMTRRKKWAICLKFLCFANKDNATFEMRKNSDLKAISH